MIYPVDFNNKFFRAFAITTDAYGIDPLKDKLATNLLNITTYTEHSVTQEERGAPDLISFNEYGKEDYWWHIMAYNGLCRWSQIVEGKIIKIPDEGSIISLTTNLPAVNIIKIAQNITII
jgi:hypothetical protein